jgi:hypothetical protein
MRIIWWHHDYVHAPLWGRGDGRTGGYEEVEMGEKLQLVDFSDP